MIAKLPTHPRISGALHVATALLLCLAVSACGGGSHGGGIGGTGLTVGVIERLGSVTVEGIVFDTSQAEIFVDGDPATEASLGLGMVVRVVGKVAEDGTTGTAETVVYETILEGPIREVDLDTERVEVLGDRLLFNDATVFDGVDFNQDVNGVLIRVSGFVDANGRIRATRIEGQQEPTVADSFSFKGVVRRVDLDARQFRIRNVTVSYADAEVIGRPVVDGEAFVVVETDPVNDVVIATLVRFFPPRPEENLIGTPIRVQGVLTRFLNKQTFVLNERVAIRVTDRTVLIADSPDDVRRNRIIAVKGVIAGPALILAEVIAVRAEFTPTEDTSTTPGTSDR